MSSFFGNMSHKFDCVPEDEKINTQMFINACSQILPFFDFLGVAFAKVQTKISGNITTLEKKYATNKEKFATLQDIVNSEIEDKTTKSKNSGTTSVLWLKRALSFIRVFLEEVLTDEEDLVKCAKKAYENSLKRYHGWMIQQVFGLAIKNVPYRKNLMKALGPDCTEDVVLSEMKETVELMAANIDTLNNFYTETGQETSDKI